MEAPTFVKKWGLAGSGRLADWKASRLGDNGCLSAYWLFGRLVGWSVAISVYTEPISGIIFSKTQHKLLQYVQSCGLIYFHVIVVNKNTYIRLRAHKGFLQRVPALVQARIYLSYIYYNHTIAFGITIALGDVLLWFGETHWWHRVFKRKWVTIVSNYSYHFHYQCQYHQDHICANM